MKAPTSNHYRLGPDQEISEKVQTLHQLALQYVNQVSISRSLLNHTHMRVHMHMYIYAHTCI